MPTPPAAVVNIALESLEPRVRMSASRPSPPLPDLIAQRGNTEDYPENTLPALRSALELGARYLQFDVQLTADRRPILLNDDNLTRLAGVNRSAVAMSWRELVEIVITEPERFGTKFTDLGVPMLAQAAGLLSAHPAVTAFISIKRASLRVFGAEVMVRTVCDVLKPVMRQCVLVSRDLTVIHQVRQIASYRVGWILSEYSTLSALKSEALVPDFLLCEHELLTNTDAQLWRGPWQWAIHNVSSRDSAARLAARGARLVGTTSLRSVLREFRKARAS